MKTCDIVHTVLRSEGRKNAMVVNTQPVAAYVEPSEASLPLAQRRQSELERFAASMIAGAEVQFSTSQGAYLQYSNSHTGASFTLHSDGTRTVQGASESLTGWPLLQEQRVSQPQGGKLAFTYGSAQCVYDFQNWTVTP